MQNYPKAIGPYSAYRVAGNFIFASGQIPINPATNELAKGDIKEQTAQCFENIKAILAENGLNLSHIIKTTVFLADINDFSQMNETYARFLNAPYPARSAFAVKDLPKGAKVEIEVIAFKG